MITKLAAVRLLSALLIALCAFTYCMEANAQKLVVFHLQDGATMEFSLSDEPVITFDAENVILTGSTRIEFPLKDMVDIEYLENSGIKDNIDLSSKPFIRKNNILIFSNFDNDTPFNIFGLDGISVFSHIIPASSSYEYNLDTLKSGVYIISINKVSYKIMVK